ncbi:hypothetical protein AB0C02_28065 [Micromonospora sp. NPDC048999]|uniref:hypothetical protein n=1 Tax=Micromonospora sp. NPDC048999 TaxID=3155391 RepID=UPI0033E8EBA8
MTADTTTPSQTDIATWLRDTGRPDTWAASLTGLPWAYIRPVCEIAANTSVHPIAALSVAATYSQDLAFRAAAAAHLAKHGASETSGPNRAERRANKRRGQQSGARRK